MKIEITGIKFNHTPGNISTGALTIRENKTRNITVPEWTPSKNSGEAKAAYSIQDINGNTITVQALFTCDTPGTKVKIQTTGGSLFGDVAAQEVTLSNNYVSFSLSGTTLTAIGVLDIAWLWQYQLENTTTWVDINTTFFRIYPLLSKPGAPWVNSTNFNNTQLPWTEVLDVTSDWAAGATTPAEVKEMITTEVYALGETPRPTIKYDTRNGATNYAYPDFRCTEFLERLAGQAGLGSNVNCTDCATIVSSFTNILGCDLWQAVMGIDFELRTLRAVGTNVWAVPFQGEFAYHEVAWEDPCDTSARLYDGCLELNTNRNIGAPVPLLPINMVFGSCTNLTDYRAYLTTSGPNGCKHCLPIPAEKQHRTVS